ncbi:MAG: hypothetical protein HYV68_00770 [Candidatus Taylorbacteria bacterium]|nr:hypothetical protein [Candidatus Taylorbacteria bacterium]
MPKNPYIRTLFLSTGLFVSLLLTAVVFPEVVGAAGTSGGFSPSTTTSGYIYLSQVPYTGLGDFLTLLGFVVIVGLWSLLVVMVFKSDKFKAMIAGMFRNVDEDPRLAGHTESGYVFDVTGNQVLNMNMNPVIDALPEHFIHKHNGSGSGNGNQMAEPADAYAQSEVKNGQGGEMITDVNAFINLVVRGEFNAVFDHLRKMKSKGIEASDFATNVVLELDAAYRAKIEGDNNKRNIVLSQIISHWNRSKIEGVIASLLSIVDRSYSDPNIGLKVALMRIMRAV